MRLPPWQLSSRPLARQPEVRSLPQPEVKPLSPQLGIAVTIQEPPPIAARLCVKGTAEISEKQVPYLFKGHDYLALVLTWDDRDPIGSYISELSYSLTPTGLDDPVSVGVLTVIHPGLYQVALDLAAFHQRARGDEPLVEQITVRREGKLSEQTRAMGSTDADGLTQISSFAILNLQEGDQILALVGVGPKSSVEVTTPTSLTAVLIQHAIKTVLSRSRR